MAVDSAGLGLRLLPGGRSGPSEPGAPAENDPARLRALSNSERALALAASDMPTHIRGETLDPIVVWEWIAQGYDRLGPALLTELSEFSRRVAVSGQPATDSIWVLRARLWGGCAREATAVWLTYRIATPDLVASP